MSQTRPTLWPPRVGPHTDRVYKKPTPVSVHDDDEGRQTEAMAKSLGLPVLKDVTTPKINEPRAMSGSELYIRRLVSVDVEKAKYKLVDDKGICVLRHNGEFLYFNQIHEAFDARDTLANQYQIETSVVYGPAHRSQGQVVARPLPKLNKKHPK